MSKSKALTKSKHVQKQATTDVDVTELKSYWRGLDIDEKLRVLHFDDRALAGRLADLQRDLCNSDLMCYKLGIRGQDAVRQEVGMDQFALEGEVGGRMVAFAAKPDFVERADLFDHIERRLGTSFLKGRPIVQRERWLSLFDTNASSWASFMSQVLKLVELAIFQAYRDSMAVAESVSCAVEAERNDQSAELVEQTGKSAKRRARKRAEKAAQTRSAPDEEDCASSLHEEVEEVGSEVQASEDTGSTMCTGDAGSTLSSFLDVGNCGDVDSVVGMPAVPEGVCCLNFDWSPEGPPIGETQDATVDLQVDWSVGDSDRMQTRWSAWLPNGLTGSAAEWHWETDGPPTVAFLKNTFVETKDISPEDDQRRSRSVPARSRPKP